jgi:serine/threonine protein kinase
MSQPQPCPENRKTLGDDAAAVETPPRAPSAQQTQPPDCTVEADLRYSSELAVSVPALPAANTGMPGVTTEISLDLNAKAAPGEEPAAEKLPRTFGEYELVEVIARGGMGVVYKAWHPALSRVVALKMILEGSFTSEASVKRFYQEARAAAGLDHPNIVPIYDIGQHEGRHYFTMPFIETGSLKSLVQEKGPLPAAEAAGLVAGIAEAVGQAHQRGILHRDLKPDNILIDAGDRPRVTDFGLAKQVADNVGLTATGVIVGTPAYMAPEQALGGKRDIGPAVDIYALGGILYFLLTGRAPFEGDSVTEVLCQVVKDVPTPPRKVKADIPEQIEAMCLKCLHKDPAQRYPSAEALAEALRAALPNSTASPSATVVSIGGHAPAGPASFSATQHGVSESIPSSPGVPHTAAAPPVPRRGSRFLVGGMSAIAAGLLVPLIAWWAGLRRDQTPQTSPAPEGPVTRVVAPAEEPARPARVVSAPEANHRDFGIKVEIVGDQVIPPADGSYRLSDGQSVRCRIQLDNDAYVGVWNYQANGTIVQLFPNELEKNYLVKKGESRVVPGNEVGDFEVQLASGAEYLLVVASTEPWDKVQGEKQGPFAVFSSVKDRERLQNHLNQTRAMVLRPIGKGPKPMLAEAVLKYEVTPR